MNITPHFQLEEFIASSKATELGIDNTMPDKYFPNLKRLSELLEQVREILGHSIHINSGYRRPELNRAVGGSALSQHMEGLAADIICPSFGNALAVCNAIAKSDLPFDQVIYERTWCHVSITNKGLVPRREVLTAHFEPGKKTTYTEGLEA